MDDFPNETIPGIMPTTPGNELSTGDDSGGEMRVKVGPPPAPHVDTPLERGQKNIDRALNALKAKGARVTLKLSSDEHAAVTEHLKDRLASPAEGSDEAAIKRLLAGEEVQAP